MTTAKYNIEINIPPPDPRIIHIIPSPEDKGWDVVREGIRGDRKEAPTLKEAIALANQYDIVNKEIVLHRALGVYEYF